MTALNKITLSAKIYNKKCPDCHKDNLESSAFCWNCSYEFPDQVAHAVHDQGHWWSSLFVTLVFLAAIVVIVFIILDAVK
ncbi:hypothetical protein KJ713_00455 [Patescibacteria group bacterium]|nr:hypothetical protein [Patescibacteria group bacterium]